MGNSCSEHCSDYLNVLQSLLDAEQEIEELRATIASLEEEIDLMEMSHSSSL